MIKKQYLKIIIMVLMLVFFVFINIYYFNFKNNFKENNPKLTNPLLSFSSSSQKQETEKEKQKVFFLKKEKGINSISESDYEGTEIKKISNDIVYNASISPSFDKILYTSELLDQGDLKENYLQIKLININDYSNEKIAEYSLSHDLGTDSLNKFSVELNWINNKLSIFLFRDNAWNNTGDILGYTNTESNETNFITNPYGPSETGLDYTFDKIRRYKTSPNGEFIALTADQKNTRFLLLYDLIKKDFLIIADDIFSDEFFFDANSDFYYTKTGYIQSDQRWIKYSPRTELSDFYNNKPWFWEKYLDAKLSPNLKNLLYFCNNYHDQLCIADEYGSNEEIVNNKKIIINDYFFNPTTEYVFFVGSEKENPDKTFLWIVLLKDKTLKKISEI